MQSLFVNFSHVGDHWDVILAFKSAAPCMCMHVEVEPSNNQLASKKSRERFVLSGWCNMRQPYIESAAALSDSCN